MPEKRVRQRALRDKSEGKAPSTQAGEFVREEMHHVREGKHGARSTKQAIAIGLSKARRSGVPLSAPKRGSSSASTRTRARRDRARGQADPNAKPNPRRSRATSKALAREGRSAASRSALSRQARGAAKRRTSGQRSAAARKASRTRRASRG